MKWKSRNSVIYRVSALYCFGVFVGFKLNHCTEYRINPLPVHRRGYRKGCGRNAAAPYVKSNFMSNQSTDSIRAYFPSLRL